MSPGVALGWSASPWRGTPVLESRREVQRCSRGRVVAASLQSQLVETSTSALAELHRTVLEGSVSSETSLEWWAVGAPAALWFMLATPGSLGGVADFLTSPFHRYREFSPTSVEVGRRIGEGSFGLVYEGYVSQENGKERLHVVLKKAKSQVSNSSEMHNTEVHMNRYLQRNAPDAVADFLGTVQVRSSEAKGRLTEGLWLVWKFQGYHTLDHFMKQRTFPDNVGKLILGDSTLSKSKRDSVKQDGLVLRKIMYHVLLCLQRIHKTGVVHRDVKPLNLILAEDSLSFKLVDLGACVNLRSGYNYVPNETIMDPVYAPPEQYVMPTTTPKLPPDPLCSLISPLVWLLNTPDRFDLFSAGLVMIQLAVKPLRSDTEMKHFTNELKRAGYDLNKWRKQCRYTEGEFALLDADGGTGWELLTALLQPRHDKAFIIWPSIVGSRPSASAALRHRFFRGITSPFPVKVDVLESVPRVLGEAGAGLVPALSHSVAQLRELETDEEQLRALREKVAAQMSASLETVKSKEFTSAISSAVPVAALSTLGISSAWMLVRSLETSAQMSYDISRNFIDSIGISGLVSVGSLLLVKPLVEKLNASRKSAKAKEQIRKLASMEDSGYGEVVSLAEAVVALDSRLDSLEALVALDNEDQYEQQVARMRSLLAQRV